MEFKISSVWAFVIFYGKFLKSFVSAFLFPEVETKTGWAYSTKLWGS